MTHAGCGLTLLLLLLFAVTYFLHTCSGTYPPPLPKKCSSTYPPTPPVNQSLSRHEFILNLLLLFLAIIHAGCILTHCTITINSDDVPLSPLNMFGQVPIFSKMFGHLPPATVNQTVFRHDVIWQLITIHSDDSCRV